MSDPLDALATEHGSVSQASDLDALAAEHGAVRATNPGTNSGIVLTAAGHLEPVAANAVRAFSQSPAVPYIAAKVGRIAGAVAPIVGGASAGGATGGLAGVAAASRGAWAGGKTGWFTGKLLQNVAKPIASAMEKAAPYAQTLSTLGAAQSVNDLAQMAEPNRRDIGFLGIGKTVEPDVAMLTAAVKKGANATQAAAQLTNGDPRKFAELLTAYSRSLGQGR